MKWLSKLFKSTGSNRGGGGGSTSGRHHPQFLGEESMVWPAPRRSLDDRSRADREKEELDQAIALSLAEDLKRPNGQRWRSNTDEDYAWALQDSQLNPSFPPYDPSHYYPRRYVVAATVTLAMAITWDAWAHIFIQIASVAVLVATQSLSTRCHPFWAQKYCPSHEHDHTSRCCSCERLESWNTRYYSLEDGRSLCLECMESAIMDTGDCQPLYHAIRDYYEGMNMKLDQQIPMLLVERQALNEAIGYHHMPETRGLCLSEEQTVTSILRRPRIGGNRLVGMRTQPQKLTRKCEVTAILVLYGLPRLLTGAILAHELMHGWLRLKGYRNLNPEVEEGICQVLSYMWLESEVLPDYRNMPSTSSASTSSSSSKKGGKSEVEKKLGEFFMHQIAHDASPAYGEGFRIANAAVNKYGLRRTLEHIRLTGNFPL
ncbi:protein DA1-related 2 [Citrus sinensis]|uniref:Protein DA1-related 2 n=1 Tax=Citrus sinensis TaxID=2711 RepID=A0ACB8L0L6_CITSI|nr:protein DA1-related 2 [Citrus sinensis]